MLTGDPIREAEERESIAEREPHIHCDICGKRIYRETGIYDGDEYYEIDGFDICEECILDYIKRYKHMCE